MAASATDDRRIPLPRHGPRASCSDAEHHVDARVRLQADNDRMRREIGLLHEELRIDVRMERLPAQRRHHYPPIERVDDEGPDALVQVREPVNRFRDFVAYLVQRLKVLCSQGESRARLARPDGRS